MEATDPLDLAICSTCGTQYPFSLEHATSCKICDDPRQYVPATGQEWTTLRTLQSPSSSSDSSSPVYKNIITPDPHHPTHLFSIRTDPKLAIGHRAFLCRTTTTTTTSNNDSSDSNTKPLNILWDCITYIDDETIAQIKALGGIHAIVISHPHYFATNLVWAEAFNCPVFLSREDKNWIMRLDPSRQVLWDESPDFDIATCLSSHPLPVVRPPSLPLPLPLPLLDSAQISKPNGDIAIIKTGGHFPGSCVLWWKSLSLLLVADTIGVVPSARYTVDRPPGTISFTFMWSYPNMIPLPPAEVHQIWKSVKHADFEETRGAFEGMETVTDSKRRVLESAQIYIRAMGYTKHEIFQESFE